jgi:hypothetical protein
MRFGYIVTLEQALLTIKNSKGSTASKKDEY